MDRREFLNMGVAGGAGLLGSLPLVGRRRTGLKNVLLIIDEDIQNGILGCCNPAVKTPAIDAFSRRAVRFDNAYCAMPECGPSRGAIFSGRRPQETGIYDNKASFQKDAPGVPLMPGVFRRNGYVTANTGKMLHPPDNHDPELWDRSIGIQPDTPDREPGDWRNFTDGRIPWAWWWAPQCADSQLPDACHADAAIEFLRNHDGRKPFFFGVGFSKPHDPFVAPRRYFDLYPLDSLELPSMTEPEDATPPNPFNYNRIFSEVLSERDEREFLRARYACMTYVDAQFGRLMAYMSSSGLLRNTVVVFMGDHGFHHGEHGGHWGKWTLYENALKSPVMIYDPDLGPGEGSVCSGAVEFIDLFPTLCELCAVPAPEGLSGRSLVPLLRNPSREWEHPAFGAWRGGRGRAVRMGDWKYMEWQKGESGRMLFNLREDPGEYHDLADKPEHADLVARMHGLIAETYYGKS